MNGAETQYFRGIFAAGAYPALRPQNDPDLW